MIENEEIKSLKEKLDALINKGIELSKDLDVNQRNKIIKKVIDESIDQALKNIEHDDEDKITQGELTERKKEIRIFIEEYFKKRIKNTL